MIPVESLLRSLDTGLENRPPQPPGPRLYQRIIHRCGECHSFCPGTQFRASTCAKTGARVGFQQEPPESCPLPVI